MRMRRDANAKVRDSTRVDDAVGVVSIGRASRRGSGAMRGRRGGDSRRSGDLAARGRREGRARAASCDVDSRITRWFVTDGCVWNVGARADNMIQIRKDKREEAMLKKRRWARARDATGRGRRWANGREIGVERE